MFSIMLAASQDTVRGIERIDLGYITHLFQNWPADCFGVFPTVLGPRLFSREQVLSGRDLLVAMWRENSADHYDPAFEWLKEVYDKHSQRQPAVSPVRRSSKLRGYGRVARLILRDGVRFGLPMSALPANSLYIDVGHNGLATPFMYKWLTRRPDVKPVFMIHDAIPLELPELVSQRNAVIHHKIIATTAAYARAVIVPTASAGRAVRAGLAQLSAPEIPIHAVHLPIDDVFRLPYEKERSFTRHPYFLVCGVFEARKNPMILINVWRSLIAEMGAAAPRLVFAGRPGYGSGDAIEQIRRSRILRDHVFLASGLSTNSLARLMVGARALLMPSFAEGFGLPTVEALTVGTPVILSDIPAHRDAAGSYGVFIDPIDGTSWLKQIKSLTSDPEAYAGLRRRVCDYASKDWSDYMNEIGGLLKAL